MSSFEFEKLNGWKVSEGHTSERPAFIPKDAKVFVTVNNGECEQIITGYLRNIEIGYSNDSVDQVAAQILLSDCFVQGLGHNRIESLRFLADEVKRIELHE